MALDNRRYGNLTDQERRDLARAAAMRAYPELQLHIAPRKPIQEIVQPYQEPFERCRASKRPPLGPPEDQA